MKTNPFLQSTVAARTNIVARLCGLVGLCALFSLTFFARAQTTNYFCEGFETDQARDDWFADSGTWEIGVPTFGPPTNSLGQRAFFGTNCAATVLAGEYATGVDSRLVSPVFVVPAAGTNPRLRFWHWYDIAADGADYGQVEIKPAGGSWQPLSQKYVASSSGVWTRPSLDLSAYAGQSVQVAFRIVTIGCCNAPGWYIDDVCVVTGAPTLPNPEGFEGGLGDWSAEAGTWEIGVPTSGPGSAHEGTNVAATVLAGNYATGVDSRLVSPAFVVPPAGAHPRLRFWHWFDIAADGADYGQVEIKPAGGDWQPLSQKYVGTSGGVWTRPSLDPSAYAGQSVQVAFRIVTIGCCNAPGWYIDEVRLTHDFALLLLDAPIVRAQDNFCVSLGIADSSAVSTLSFTLQAPAGNLSNVTLNGEGCWTNATITPQPNSQWFVTLQNSCTTAPMGVKTIGSLCFTAVSAQSAFVPLTINNLVVTNQDASIPTVHAFGSRAVVIANEPLLEGALATNSQRVLTVFGKPGARYDIQHTDDLRGVAAWSPGWTNTVPTNMFYRFPIDGTSSNAPVLFLRAREQ